MSTLSKTKESGSNQRSIATLDEELNIPAFDELSKSDLDDVYVLSDEDYDVLTELYVGID